MVRKTVTTYEVRGYSKKSNEYDKKVSVSNWEVNFEVDNWEDAHRVAKLAKLTSYGIIENKCDEEGYHIGDRDGKRVFVTPDVLEWEAEVVKQENANEARKQAAILAINALPKTITLYKDEEFLITATRGSAGDSYRGFDIKYDAQIKFKGANFEHFNKYLTDGWNRKNGILRKKFAKDVYDYSHSKDRYKKGWREWEETLKNLPEAYVAKYGVVLETAVNVLKENNAKIDACKLGV